jgi:hypothetical protein
MEVSGQLHAPAALPLEKEHKVPIRQEWGWVGPRAGLDAVAKITFPSPCQKSNPDRPARSLERIAEETLIRQ